MKLDAWCLNLNLLVYAQHRIRPGERDAQTCLGF